MSPVSLTRNPELVTRNDVSIIIFGLLRPKQLRKYPEPDPEGYRHVRYVEGGPVVLIVIYIDEVCHVPVTQPVIHVSQSPREDAGEREFHRFSMSIPQEVVDQACYDYDG